MDAEQLSTVVAEQLRAGPLRFSESQQQIWGGPSGGTRCHLCGACIARGQTELEVVGPAGVTRFYHPNCFDVVSAARQLDAACCC